MVYLLHEHDDFGRNQGSPIPGYGDQFDNFTLADGHVGLGIEQSVHVEDVSRSLNFGVPELDHRTIGFGVAALAHIPTW